MLLFIVNFFRTFLVILAIYLIVKWVFKPANSVKKEDNKNKSQNEGETTIRYNKKGEKIIDKNKGEYVDFEEVD